MAGHLTMSRIYETLKQVQDDKKRLSTRLSDLGSLVRFCILQFAVFNLHWVLLKSYGVEHTGNQILPPDGDDLDTLAERFQCFNQMTGNLHTCLPLIGGLH